MGLNTKIEYAEHTWNPVMGCDKISEGCRNCFAEVWHKRYGHDFSKIRRASDATFYAPLKWKEPAVILVSDLGDFFHKDVQRDWQRDAFCVMSACKQHQFLLLTKRPKNIKDGFIKYFPENIWLGVSVENQKAADERIPELLKIPHFKKWVSFEPLIGKVDALNIYGKLDWVIVGGETGKGARNMKPEWVRLIKNRCFAYTNFFMKQMSNREPIPKDLMVREYPPELKEIMNAKDKNSYRRRKSVWS